MKKLSLKAKLGLGFGSLLLIIVALGVVGYNAVGTLAAISKRTDEIMAKKDMASQIEAAAEKQTTGIRGFLIMGKEDLLKHDEEGKLQFADEMDHLGRLLVTEEGKKLHAEIRTSSDSFRLIADHEIALRRAGKTKEAVELAFSESTSQVRNQMRKAVADLVLLEDRLKEETLKEQTAVESRVRRSVLLLAFAGIGVGLIVAVLVARSIAAALAVMLLLIEQIAANNLVARDVEFIRRMNWAGRALLSTS
jgi:methyl-accepting chemotaxis protein